MDFTTAGTTEYLETRCNVSKSNPSRPRNTEPHCHVRPSLRPRVSCAAPRRWEANGKTNGKANGTEQPSQPTANPFIRFLGRLSDCTSFTVSARQLPEARPQLPEARPQLPEAPWMDSWPLENRGVCIGPTVRP